MAKLVQKTHKRGSDFWNSEQVERIENNLSMAAVI